MRVVGGVEAGREVESRRGLAVDGVEFGDALGVAAFFEVGGEENFDDFSHLVVGDEVGAHAEDVAVVVGAGDACGDFIVGEGGADAADFVGGYGHADAGFVEEDSDVDVAVLDFPGDEDGDVGVVDGGVGVAAEVVGVVLEGAQHGQQPEFGVVSAVVTCDGDSQERSSEGRREVSDATPL